MYEECSVLVVNKMDAMPVFDFDCKRLERDVRALNPGMQIFYISAKTGEGVEALAEYLIRQVKEWNA
jgi:hydrogenase nickel incorporation protein HypB